MNVIKQTILYLSSALIISGAALAKDVTPDNRVKRSVIVRQKPTSDSAPIGRLFVGQSLTLIEEESAWYEVRLPDGSIGYVSKAWTRTSDGDVSSTGSTFKVHVIDVGTGLSVFIEGTDFAMLYDGGSQDDLAKGDDNRVVRYIKAVAPSHTTINHLVLSHPHKDHVELLPDVFDRYIVKNVYDSGTVNLTVGYCNFLRKVSEEVGVKYHDAISSGQVRTVPCKAGVVSIQEADQMTAASVPLGQNASMSILYRDATKHPDPNENSVVVRLDLGQKRILLAGDAEGGERRLPASPPDNGSIEQKLLECCKVDLKADALVVGHHGSMSSSRQSFIDAVDARLFVISSGPFTYGKNRIKLPDGEIVKALEAEGTVYRTDENDEECTASTAKIGLDADESPGGCSNVVIRVEGNTIEAEYQTLLD